MKVLILSCNTGEGHNSAGRAVREALRARGVHCEMIDALQFGFRGESKLISQGHSFVYRHLPHLFGTTYRLMENHKPEKGDSLVYRTSSLRTEKLYRYIVQRGFDTIVCVHVFPAAAMTRIRRTCNPALRIYFVATDYTCSPGVGDLQMDAWFTPHWALEENFVARGLPRERLVATGIPVSGRFVQRRDRAEARRLLGLPEQGRLVLMMSGSMGAGPIGRLVAQLSAQLPADAVLAVICGRNEKLRARLDRAVHRRVRVIGYTDQVDLYMDAAELILTKAGGLSSTEALMKRLPIVYLNAVPGCETRNRDFLCQLDCAITMDRVSRLASATVHLLEDPARLARMRMHIDEHFRQRAADDIAAYLIQHDRPECGGDGHGV